MHLFVYHLNVYVATDTPATILVVGESGLGKTRFLLEAESALYRSHAQVTVAYGRALAQHSESNGFQPLREALTDLVFEAQRQSREGMLRRIGQSLRETAPDWLQAVPAVGKLLSAASRTFIETLRREDESQLDDSLTRQFCRLVAEIAEEAPLVLCLDDLHWADSSTVDLIYSLTQTVQTGKFLLVCAYREEDLRNSRDTPHPLLETVLRIERYGSVGRIELQHLAQDHVEEIVREVFEHPPRPELINNLYVFGDRVDGRAECPASDGSRCRVRGSVWGL
jgi:predicted ATPase